MIIKKEDRELIEELFNKFNKGERIKSQVLTDLYNRVTGKNLTNTSCASCLRQRLFELVDILNKEKIDIARRTVAKYRETLGLEPSSQRKKAFQLQLKILIKLFVFFPQVVVEYNKVCNVFIIAVFF